MKTPISFKSLNLVCKQNTFWNVKRDMRRRENTACGTQGNQRDTRQNNDLTLPQYRLATGQKNITYRGAKLYSNIAKDIRDTGNLNVFKKRIFNIFLVHR